MGVEINEPHFLQVEEWGFSLKAYRETAGKRGLRE